MRYRMTHVTPRSNMAVLKVSEPRIQMVLHVVYILGPNAIGRNPSIADIWKLSEGFCVHLIRTKIVL